MSISFFLIFTIIVVFIYQWGHRKNLRLSREWAKDLETVFQPKEKQYRWLGGVLGFIAEYQVPGFKSIKAVLRLRPRHSLLYIPFALFTGYKDKLQILLYLSKNTNQEFHLLKKGQHIEEEKRFKIKDIHIYGREFLLLYEKELPLTTINLFSHRQLCLLRHLALIKKQNILFLEFHFCPAENQEVIKAVQKLFLTFT